MKSEIRRKIEEALAGTSPPSASAQQLSVSASPSTDNLDGIVDQVMREKRWWKIREIAAKHNLSYWTVYRQFKGKPGCVPFGRTWRVPDSAYRDWIRSTVLKGLTAA